MTTPDETLFPSPPDLSTLEAECRDLWEAHAIHSFDPDGEGELFSVDTPPPYVSAAYLHVGHAMSYTQAEIIVRWQRMRGRRVHYPMGFDDNGLPTERYVEKAHGIDKSRTSRSDFRALCLDETRRGAATYEHLWRALGLSVDWSLRYSTIDEHCRRTAQRSFLELLAAGEIYRAEEPVLWDPALGSALSQADLESLERRSTLHDIAFSSAGEELIIATTRPELLPACVALYRHPDDPRYAHLEGGEATVPLSGHAVPILADTDVDPDFGTGLMMVCTFGDREDVRRWRRDGLDTRVILDEQGRLTVAPWQGMKAQDARRAVLADLESAGLLRGSTPIKQVVSVGERSGAPVEWLPRPQWFLRLLEHKEALLERSAELQWNPPWMRARLDHWIQGLEWDWNLSRQRFYGVPMPVWLCEDCAHPVPARVEDLPVDPLEHSPPLERCPRCGGALRGDPDVMDTWMTSSLTPMISANWAGSPGRAPAPLPSSLRVQGFEIIRTWLFYTLLKGHLHTGALPWEAVMISGWGLNEQGRKISKRHLERHTDASGFNRYEPLAVIHKYGADALRHWAASTHLGQDSRYTEKAVRAGRKLAIKLYNTARFASLVLDDFDPSGPRPAAGERPIEDRWLLQELSALLPRVHQGFESYDYATGLEALDRFFWGSFCDDWLEMAKERLYRPEAYPEGARLAAQATLWEALRTLVGLYAPYLPFVTEAIYQRLFRAHEGSVSLHTTPYPEPGPDPALDTAGMSTLRAIMKEGRALRSERRLGQATLLDRLVMGTEGMSAAERQAVADHQDSLRAMCRVERVELREGAHLSFA